MMDKKYEVIFCIVNAGFSEVAMNAAKKAGARGGTVLHGRGTGSREAEELFKITVQPEKELVMILVPADIKDKVMTALYEEAGLESAGHGIAFSLPAERTLGLDGSHKEEGK
ncbi:MAG: P-II family nitrogen regulator [Clostridia bacterium]|nr:P-II family nitrogen regulator [Clostridia bacterium]MBR5721815.1 P-II family nitrogen regulator [Clostridia bacterium]